MCTWAMVNKTYRIFINGKEATHSRVPGRDD